MTTKLMIDPALDVYEQMAPVYDQFTAHHDYELWLGQLLPALEATGLRGQRLLDVGCGTGKSFIPMLRRGWEVTAIDQSPAMLERARAKVGGAAALYLGDLRSLAIVGAFDLVWTLDDALNYLTCDGELDTAVAGLAANLAPSGRLLFDLNTLLTYRTFFAEAHTSSAGETELHWRGRSTPDAEPGGIVEAEFEALIGETRRRGIHRQRHWRPEQALAAIAKAGLRCLAVYGHGYDAVLRKPLDEREHTKAIFIAAKPEQGEKGGA